MFLPLFLLVLSTKAFCHFQVDQNRFEFISTMNFDKETEDYYKDRATALLQFLESKEKEHLPKDVLSLVSQYTIKIRLVKDLIPQALFIGEENPGSKELIILFNPLLLTSKDFDRLLIHEYFHAVHSAINPGEEAWIREGLAQVFESRVTKKSHAPSIMATMKNPSHSPVSAMDHNHQDEILYGNTFLYFQYLVRECGGPSLFWKLALPDKEALRGLDHLERTLKENHSLRPQCENATQSLFSYQLAKLINRVDYSNFSNSQRYYLTSERADLDNLKTEPKENHFHFVPYLEGETPLDLSQNRHVFALPKKASESHKSIVIYSTDLP